MTSEENYIQQLKDHIKCCEDAMKYSMDRFDILIITLSSGALGFSMSFIKDIAKSNNYNYLILLKFSWLLFGSSLILNLISQVTSYFAHKYEMRISKSLIKKERGKAGIPNERGLEKTKKFFDSCTNYLNFISLLSLILGIVVLIIFTYSNF